MESLHKIRLGFLILINFSFLLFIGTSCSEPLDLSLELKRGYWKFQFIEDKDGKILMEGREGPELRLYFLENNILKGSVRGDYLFQENHLFIQGQIDTIINVFAGETNVLARFPQRYYDFENIFISEISGTIEFSETSNDDIIDFNLKLSNENTIWFRKDL